MAQSAAQLQCRLHCYADQWSHFCLQCAELPGTQNSHATALSGYAGLIKPLPADVFPIEEATDALRQLSAAKHIGKVVVEVSGQLPTCKGAQGRWIVSGGLGALGTLSVQWLASQGMHACLAVNFVIRFGRYLSEKGGVQPCSDRCLHLQY